MGQGGLAAAGNDHVGLVVANELEGVAHGVGGAGTGRDDHLVRSLQPVLDRELPLAALPISLGMVKAETCPGLFRAAAVLNLDRLQAADARAENHAAAPGVFLREVDAGVAHGIDAGDRANCTKRSNRLISLASI